MSGGCIKHQRDIYALVPGQISNIKRKFILEGMFVIITLGLKKGWSSGHPHAVWTRDWAVGEYRHLIFESSNA